MLRFLFLFAIAVAMTCGASAQPVFKFEKGDTHNWGKVKFAESPLKARIKIINPGTDSLKIYKVKPGCSCTAAPIEKDKLAPGDSTFVDVTLNIPNVPGQVHKTVFFSTSDPDNREAMLHLVAEVLFPFRYFPSQYFGFMNMLVGDSSTSKVIITNTTDHDIVIKEVKTEPDNLKVNIKEDDVVKAGKEIEVIATANPDKIGPYTGKVMFKTTDPDMPRVEIFARGQVVGYKDQFKK